MKRGGYMSVKQRIVAIRLAERVARNREYAEAIGVLVIDGKAEYNREERNAGLMYGKDGYYGHKSGTDDS